MIKSTLILFAILLIAPGCALGPFYQVHVDSIRAPNTLGKTTYLLIPNVDGVTNNDLQYLEYAKYIEIMLSSSGFKKASDYSEANVVIFLSYGIGDPSTQQYSYSMPTWGQTGVSGSTTYGTSTTIGNTTTLNATTSYTPSYGINGSKTYVGNRTTYFRYVTLNAFDLEEFKKSEKEIQLWKTIVTSNGTSGDLRQVFPILVAASKPYINTNTGAKVKVILSENDKRVKEVKNLKY